MSDRRKNIHAPEIINRGDAVTHVMRTVHNPDPTTDNDYLRQYVREFLDTLSVPQGMSASSQIFHVDTWTGKLSALSYELVEGVFIKYLGAIDRTLTRDSKKRKLDEYYKK